MVVLKDTKMEQLVVVSLVASQVASTESIADYVLADLTAKLLDV